MDLKVMLKSHKGHKFILCIIDEVTNYLITVPIYNSRSGEIGSALIEKIDRQLSGQSGTSTPFMKVGDAHNSNRI